MFSKIRSIVATLAADNFTLTRDVSPRKDAATSAGALYVAGMPVSAALMIFVTVPLLSAKKPGLM